MKIRMDDESYRTFSSLVETAQAGKKEAKDDIATIYMRGYCAALDMVRKYIVRED